FQEIFATVHRAAATYQADRPIRPWLFTIAANLVRSHYRAARSRDAVLRADGAAPDRHPAPDGYQLTEARETAAWMEATIAALPEAQRQVVVLCCIEQLSHSEVATILAMPVNTVKTHLRRARSALAQRLARRRAALRREVTS